MGQHSKWAPICQFSLPPAIGTIAVLILMMTNAQLAFSQVQPVDLNLDTGIKMNEAFDRAQENVNILSGNLNVQIPLVDLPGRNGHDFKLGLTYNSQNWTPIATLVNPGVYPGDPNTTYGDINIEWEYASAQGAAAIGSTGWQLNIPELYATAVMIPPQNCSNGPTCGGGSYSQSTYIGNFVLVTGDGTKYSFQNARLGFNTTTTNCPGGESSCTTSTTYVPSNDYLIDYDTLSGGAPNPTFNPAGGQGVMLDLTQVTSGSGTAVVRFRDGSQIQFSINWFSGKGNNIIFPSGAINAGAAQMVDTNGNVVSVSIGGNTITDTVGRQITVGTSGVSYKDSQGTTRTITFNYSGSPVTSNPPSATFSTPTTGTSIQSIGSETIGGMLSSVVLPDGLTYTFQYNEYGELLEITYPSGGYTRYAYQALANANQYEWTTAVSGSADARVVTDKYSCTAVAVSGGTTAPAGYVGSSASNTCPVSENHTNYQRNSLIGAAVTDPEGNKAVYGAVPITGSYYQYPNGTGGCSVQTAPNSSHDALLNYSYGSSYLEMFRQIYEGTSTLLRTITSSYQGCYKIGEAITLPNGSTSGTTWTYDTAPNITATTVTDNGYSETYNAYAETDNVLTKSEYGFGSGAPGGLLRKTTSTYLSTNSINNTNYLQPTLYILDRLQQQTVQDGSSNQVSQTTYEYDSYQGGIVASGAVQHGIATNSYAASYTTRGNVTAISRWLNAPAGTLTTRNYKFDDAGNVLIVQDPRGYPTQYGYQDAWANTGCAPASNGVAAAYVTSVVNALGQTTNYAWNSCSGTIGSFSDLNQNQTVFAYDLMDRRVEASYPDGGQACLQYSDSQNQYCPTVTGSALPITVQTTTKMSSAQSETLQVQLDGLARPTKNITVSTPNISVDTTYDALGNVASVSNPYYQGTQGYGIVQYQYDALDRKIIQTQQDGSNVQWCYEGVQASGSQTNCSANLSTINHNASWIDFTDENGSHWQHVADSLGRLVAILEPNPSNGQALETDYVYDPLNDLTAVTQNGTTGETPRSRSFSYDSLSRLVRSTDPETGTICYGQLSGSNCTGGYDGNSNLLYKTDAIGTVSSYTYDALNRLTGKSFTDGSRSQVYAYDGKDRFGNTLPNPYSQNAIGRLSQSSDTTSVSSHFAYDSMGRLIAQSDCQATECAYNNQMQATYDLAGDQTSFTFYDGRVVKQSWDSARRLAAVWDATGGNSSPVYLSGPSTGGSSCPSGTPITSCVGYAASGAVTASIYGNGVSQSLTINSRLQPCHATASWMAANSNFFLLDRQSFYSSSASSPCGYESNDNGNIYSIVDNLQVGLTQSFSYDVLNRITSGSRADGAYNHTYSYDSFGNMVLKDNLSNSAVEYEPDPAGTNRLLRSHDGGTTWGDYVYDATGTLTQSSDGINPTHTYQHNAMGQLLSVDSGTDTYLYDGADQRAFKETPSSTITYAYFSGQPIAEMDQNGNWTDYIYANGQKIARVQQTDPHLHVAGSPPTTGYDQWYSTGLFNGYVIQAGDRLVFRQFQQGGARGGIIGTSTAGSSQNYLTDQNGDFLNSSTVSNRWETRIVPIDAVTGVSVTSMAVGMDVTSTGPGSVDIADVSIISADGAVHIGFNGQTISLSNAGGNMPQASGSYVSSADPSESATSTYYYIDDHLGSTQLELSEGGWPVWSGQFTPFGQEIVGGQVLSATLGNQQPADGTNMHYKFTGKERDTESGLDYFGARYMNSAMGRFMSPDPIKITEDRVANPNTLNLYSYAANNPLKYVDPDGQDITYFYDQGGIAGHAVIFAYNQQTGDGAIESFGPIIHSPMAAGESMFDLGPNVTADQLRQTFAALTIQTSPELAQQVIDYIRSNPDPDNWKAWGPNCSTQCAKILQKFKLEMSRDKGKRPKLLWNALKQQYNPNAPAKPTGGLDYGAPRRDMFGAFWNQIQQNWKDDPIEGTPKKNTAPPCLKDRNTGNCV